MAAATQDREAMISDGFRYGVGVASGIQLYAGTLVSKNAAGNLVATAVGSTTVLGVLMYGANNTSSNDNLTTVSAGAVNGVVARRGIYRFNYSVTPTQAVVGLHAFPTDNQTVGGTTAFGASGGVQYVGQIVGWGTAPYNYVDVDIDITQSL